ncbi:hypothetical protein [Oleidesulfovibrio sp.]|uniref:hypothetical protein n=1 Tax=Oleidesulfovibrio sp. TaxID=2909707 RepID=UPI003A8535CA
MAIIFQDDFEGSADGTELSTHNTGWLEKYSSSGYSPALEVRNGAVVRTAAYTGEYQAGDGSLYASGNYAVEAVASVGDKSGSLYLQGRRTAGKGYYALVYNNDAQEVFIRKSVNGTNTVLASAPFILPSGTQKTFRLELEGSALRCTIDGVAPFGAVTDTELTEGPAGIALWVTGWPFGLGSPHLTQFTVETLSEAIPVVQGSVSGMTFSRSSAAGCKQAGSQSILQPALLTAVSGSKATRLYIQNITSRLCVAAGLRRAAGTVEQWLRTVTESKGNKASRGIGAVFARMSCKTTGEGQILQPVSGYSTTATTSAAVTLGRKKAVDGAELSLVQDAGAVSGKKKTTGLTASDLWGQVLTAQSGLSVFCPAPQRTHVARYGSRTHSARHYTRLITIPATR